MPCSMPALPRKSGNPTQGMAQHQRLNRRGRCTRVARFEVLKLVLARGCGDPRHASMLSIDVTQFPYGGQLSTEGAPGLPNRLKSAAVRRRLIIFSIGICCHKVAWITSG